MIGECLIGKSLDRQKPDRLKSLGKCSIGKSLIGKNLGIVKTVTKGEVKLSSFQENARQIGPEVPGRWDSGRPRVKACGKEGLA